MIDGEDAPLLTVGEVARRLGLSRTRVRQLVADGRLEVLAVAGARFRVVTRAEFERFASLPRRAGRPPK